MTVQSIFQTFTIQTVIISLHQYGDTTSGSAQEVHIMLDRIINIIVCLLVMVIIIGLAVLAFSGVGLVLQWIHHYVQLGGTM